MDEKELMRRIKNSIKAGRSDVEIAKSLQANGYKLEYINVLLKKARRGKRILMVLGVCFVFFLLLMVTVGAVGYSMFFASSGVKMNMSNPLDGMNINFEKRGGVVGYGGVDINDNSVGDSARGEVYVDDVEITPEFISYLLNELGAWELKPNPLTGEKPIINFIIEGEEFSSVVDSEIISSRGLSSEADVDFYSNKEDILRAMLSENSADVFRVSYEKGGSSLEVKKSEVDLFAKGYLKLYDSLKF